MKTNLFEHYKPATLKAFKKFHAENPHVYERFKELAEQIYKTGRKKYSSKVIINVMRWEYDLKSNAKPYKVNDRFQSIYGRLLAYHEPKYLDFFEFRTRQNSGTNFTEEDFYNAKET